MRLLLFLALAWLVYRFVKKTIDAQQLRAARREALGPDPHEVLGVRPGASPDAIRAAYRSLAKQHHPDVAPPDQREAAAQRMRRIQQAYEALTKR